jgi:hypothetical protein
MEVVHLFRSGCPFWRRILLVDKVFRGGDAALGYFQHGKAGELRVYPFEMLRTSGE